MSGTRPGEFDGPTGTPDRGPRSLAAGILGVVVALAAAVAVALPTHVSWVSVRAMAPWAVAPTVVVGNVAAWSGALLAAVLAVIRPRFPGTREMALALGLGTLAYGTLTAELERWTGASPIVTALGLSSAVLAGAGIVRFWSIFPRPLTSEDVGRFEPSTSPEPWATRTLMRGIEVVFAPFLRLVRAHRRRAEARAARGERNRVEEWIQGMRVWLFVRFPAVVWLAGIVVAAVVVALTFEGRTTEAAWVGAITSYGLVLVAIMSSAVRYGVADPGERRRLLWIAEGFTGGVTVALLLAWTGGLLVTFGGPSAAYGLVPLGLALGSLFLVASLAIAAFWDGVFDPALALRGTVIYGLLMGFVVFVFALVEESASIVLTSWLGLSDQLGTWLAAGVVALILTPLQRWLDGWVRSWEPGERASTPPERSAEGVPETRRASRS